MEILDQTATGQPTEWVARAVLASFPVTDFNSLAAELKDNPNTADRVVLDARRGSEFDAGHIDGAVNVPIHRALADRVDPAQEAVGSQCPLLLDV